MLTIYFAGGDEAICLNIKPGWPSMPAENYIYPALHETKARGQYAYSSVLPWVF